jgi:hypothetical protein
MLRDGHVVGRVVTLEKGLEQELELDLGKMESRLLPVHQPWWSRRAATLSDAQRQRLRQRQRQTWGAVELEPPRHSGVK